MTRPSQLLECVPNFSVGPDRDTIGALRRTFERVNGVHVLDIHSDASHNRSVFTVVGTPIRLLEATFDAVETALQNIDLRHHRGVHPRIGVADVIPFVAIPPTAPNVAVTAARQFAEATAHALDLPIYLYEQATLGDRARPLPEVRRGASEWARTARRAGHALPPDFGPHVLHPRWGASAVGARPFLVAFNIDLDTHDVAVARDIARRIRASTGGHPGIRALGLPLPKHVQVSMNLYDLTVISIPEAYDLVATLARETGVGIVSSELVGLAPRAAFREVDPRAIKLPGRIEDYTLDDKLDEILW